MRPPRRLSLLAVGIAAAMSISSCGGGDKGGSPSVSPEENPSEQTTNGVVEATPSEQTTNGVVAGRCYFNVDEEGITDVSCKVKLDDPPETLTLSIPDELAWSDDGKMVFKGVRVEVSRLSDEDPWVVTDTFLE